MEGLNNLNLGACYFYLTDYVKAVACYHQVQNIFESTENKNWLGFTYYNLAEAEAILGNISTAKAHLETGVAIGKRLGINRLLTLFEELSKGYPWLMQTDLNGRQQQALAYVLEHGHITNRDYRELCGVAQKTTASDLRGLVEQDLLVKIGQGRSIKYVQP